MLIKITVLEASGHLVSKNFGTRVIDATKIDEIRSDEHIQARDKDGNKVPDVDGQRQYEPKAVRLIRYLEGAGAGAVQYLVRGTVTEWRDRINKKRFTQVLSLDQEESATDA